MSEDLFGVVINLNAFGATVRLSDGSLASVPCADVEVNRAAYERALLRRSELRFVRRPGGRHALVMLVPEISDARLDEKIATFMKSTKSTEEQRAHHFLQKKRRADIIESKHKGG